MTVLAFCLASPTSIEYNTEEVLWLLQGIDREATLAVNASAIQAAEDWDWFHLSNEVLEEEDIERKQTKKTKEYNNRLLAKRVRACAEEG